MRSKRCLWRLLLSIWVRYNEFKFYTFTNVKPDIAALPQIIAFSKTVVKTVARMEHQHETHHLQLFRAASPFLFQ